MSTTFARRVPSPHTAGAAALLALALVMPVQEAKAQDPLIGGILGGAAGAIIGGAAGGRRGATIGAIIGGATGAIIAAEGQRRGGYSWWRNDCYAQRGYGSWIRVSPGYCGGPAVYAAPPPRVYGPPPGYYPPPGDPIANCMQRYRSYDPVSQTYLGYDGYRHPCP